MLDLLKIQKTAFPFFKINGFPLFSFSNFIEFLLFGTHNVSHIRYGYFVPFMWWNPFFSLRLSFFEFFIIFVFFLFLFFFKFIHLYSYDVVRWYAHAQNTTQAAHKHLILMLLWFFFYFVGFCLVLFLLLASKKVEFA